MSRHLPTRRGPAAPTTPTPPLRPSLPSHAPPAVRTATQGGGQALDKRTSAEMSAKFGHNFSQVRIHTDRRAGDAAGALGANAFALGGDVVFGAGKYQPGSVETERLLAHELTHVVQQSRFGPGDWGRASHTGDASEREADGLASQVMLGRSVQVRAAPGAAVARDYDPLDGPWAVPTDFNDELNNLNDPDDGVPLPGADPLVSGPAAKGALTEPIEPILGGNDDGEKCYSPDTPYFINPTVPDHSDGIVQGSPTDQKEGEEQEEQRRELLKEMGQEPIGKEEEPVPVGKDGKPMPEDSDPDLEPSYAE